MQTQIVILANSWRFSLCVFVPFCGGIDSQSNAHASSFPEIAEAGSGHSIPSFGSS
jgi:hypothetical protein